jgi:hypothetical protein
MTEQEKAAADYKAGSAQRDPGNVHTADNTAREHGSQSTQAGGHRG